MERDSDRIAVALAPALTQQVGVLVSALVRENAQRLWDQPVSTTSDSVFDAFRQALREHQGNVVEAARASRRLERVQLFQLAILKLFMQQLDHEMALLRHELEESAGRQVGLATGRGLQIHDQQVVLGRNARHLRYRVAHQLMREFLRLEHAAMCSLRQSLLGLSWPVPEALLANPVLQLDGLGDTRDFIRYYPILLRDLNSARAVGRCVLDTLGDWLPDGVGQPAARGSEEGAAQAANRHDHGAARGVLETGRWARCLIAAGELDEGGYSWFDEPANGLALLGDGDADGPRAGRWRSLDLGGLRHSLSQALGGRLQRAGLSHKLRASYELAAIYPSLGVADAEALVFEFLSGDLGRRELLRRLEAINPATDPTVVARRIHASRKTYRDSGLADKAQLNTRLVGDFLALRRDLKLGLRSFVALDRIQLLDDERDLARARAARVLQSFGLQESVAERPGEPTGHVILKIEVRGSDDLIAGLRRRGLDVASYFSRHFYDPVERLRARFDAHKAVVESDALIVAIVEYDGDHDHAHRWAVSRACCLAVGVAELANAMNVESDRLGLPPLELAIGIAYADEPPTYLYDQSRRVIVSSAIGQARRLSSCHPGLGQGCALPDSRGLWVAMPAYDAASTDSTDDDLVHHNVNGIELDAAAFARLQGEIRLRTIRSRRKPGKRPAVLHAGSCQDAHGDMHWLVVRERTVKLWKGRQLIDNNNGHHTYFEVISDARVIERVRGQLDLPDAVPPGRIASAVSGIQNGA